MKNGFRTDFDMKAIKLAKEWQAAQPLQKTNFVSPKDYIPSNPDSQSLQVPLDSLIIYSYAAWNSSTCDSACDSGLGWVATDALGNVCFQGSSSRSYLASVLTAEAMALKSSLEKAVTLGYKDVICFSDCCCLVGLLTENVSMTALRGILHDISVLSITLNSTSFKFISRVCNSAADGSAKNALFVLSKLSLGNE